MPSWPHHIAVYGPPGAGKTALIQAASVRGYRARDLEDVGETYPERSAFLARPGDLGPPTLFGAADLTPEEFPPSTCFVLLMPSAAELVRRVESRGDQRNHKWVKHALQVQREHRSMADQGVFDLVIEEIRPPDKILDIIVETFAVDVR